MGFLVIIKLLLVAVHAVTTISAQAPPCCSETTGSCKTACEQISLVSIATDEKERDQQLHSLSAFCSELLVPFWNCMNETLQEISKGEGWVGRPCCQQPQSRKCRLACLQAQSRLDLTPSCRHSDELAFFSCIERQESGDQCCSSTEDAGCRSACKEVFASPVTPSRQIRNAVMNSCSQHSPKVIQCVKNFTHTTPAENPTKNLHCCDKSSNSQCRTSCRRILRTKTTGQEIVDSLTQAGCGPPLPHDRLWQCFLTNADDVSPEPGTNSRLGRLGMDSAKLQCCFRAVTLSCQRLCIKTFSHEWANSWVDFDRLCQYQLAESEMLHCLAEVEEPCELGCEGLNFCSNFNHRPTELFRSCNARADQAARQDFEMWKKGIIPMPLMEIPVLDISTCHPDIWKAVACALQVKPCHQQSHVNMICKSDCIGLLSKCLDRSRLPEGQTPTTLCEMLSPPGDNPPCISISTYVVESKYTHSASEVTHPCKPNPCKGNDVCRVNHNCRFGQPCFPYTCSRGCQMGEMSQLIIPSGTLVRIPNTSRGSRCHTVCKCSAKGTLTTCTPLPCFAGDSCWVDGRKFPHGTRFLRACNMCYCDGGEIKCSLNSCHLPDEKDPTNYSGLPCNCPNHYDPVCGINGKTYPSACLAKCMGLNNNQFQFGSCGSIDPCSPNPCHHQQKCIPRRQVCLSTKQHLCKQYMCVNIHSECTDEPRFPICDTEGGEHTNFCWLFKKKKKFAHFGKCMSHCDRLSPVCGHNGETYPNECAAWIDRVLVDYEGPCSAVGIPSADLRKPRCSSVQCPNATSSQCSKVYLPGSCCPICGGAIRLLYSQMLADRYVQTLSDVTPVVIQKIASELRGHVQVAECDVYGHLSIEGDLIVIVAPVTKTPTRLQVEACIREAEKLKSLVQMGSPTIFTELSLSIFTTAGTIPYHFESHAHTLCSEMFLVMVLATLLLFLQRLSL